MPDSRPQPELQPEPQREKLGGWGLTQLFDGGNSGGAVATATADNLTQAEKDARAQQFSAVPRYTLRRLDANEALQRHPEPAAAGRPKNRAGAKHRPDG